MKTYQVLLSAVGQTKVMEEFRAEGYRFDPNPLEDHPAIITFTAGGRQVGSYHGFWTAIKPVEDANAA